MGADDPVNKSISDAILDLHVVNSSTEVNGERSEQEWIQGTYEVMKNWFSMYTKWSESWIALRYAFWIECSIRMGVPSDHGPAERQICSSQVPVKPISVSSPGLNSEGGRRNGMVLE